MQKYPRAGKPLCSECREREAQKRGLCDRCYQRHWKRREYASDDRTPRSPDGVKREAITLWLPSDICAWIRRAGGREYLEKLLRSYIKIACTGGKDE